MSSSDTGPLVSVIICFLNEEQFLGEAIASVLEQEYYNWELFLIDDGSSDGSTAIARLFAEKFPDRIFYKDHANHENLGLSASRNYGIKCCNGQLVAFLDADDIWLPKKLGQQMKIIKKYPSVGLIAEASMYWYSWQEGTTQNVLIPVGAPQDQVHEPLSLCYLLYPLGKGAAPCPSGLMVKKSVIEEVNGFEESFIKEYSLYEDQAFLGKVYLSAPVFISSACNNYYRQHKDSIVASVHSAGFYIKVRAYYLQWLKSYLRRKGIADQRLQELITRSHNQIRFRRFFRVWEKLRLKWL